MSESKIILDTIINPIKANPAASLFWLGTVLLVIGSLLGARIDQITFVPTGTGGLIVKAGTAILGAGVFAVIMKSAQFSSLFQRHIYDVFYKPEDIKNVISILDKWKIITSALLSEVLPSTHSKATQLIEQQFFNSELEYHFENYKTFYEIQFEPNSTIATVKTKTETTIVLAPNAEEPTLLHRITGKDDAFAMKVIAFRINGKSIVTDELYKPDPNNPKNFELRLPLKKYAKKHTTGTDLQVNLERQVETKQDFKKDPYLKGDITRYVKGCTICIKTNNPTAYKLHFERFGLGDLPAEHHLEDEGLGFQRWSLADPDDLLLPGQGFIVMIVPNQI